MKEESISLQPKKTDQQKQDEKKARHLEHKFKSRKSINFGRLALGLFLVLAGIYYFAQNTGFLPKSLQIDISWWQLWPLLIVFAGLSLLSSKSRIIALASGLVTILVILIIGYLFITKSDALEKYSQPTKTTPFQINNQSSRATNAEVLIEAYGTSLNVIDSEGPMAQGKLVSNVSDLQINTSTKEDIQFATISTKGLYEKFPTKYVNNLDVSLNNEKPTKLIVDVRASKASLGLQRFLLTDLEVKADASQLRISFPDRSLGASLDVRTSNVSLVFPRNSGVQITTDSDLSRENFKGLMQVLQDETTQVIYQTQNFNNSDNKINVEISSTLSNFKTYWLE